MDYFLDCLTPDGGSPNIGYSIKLHDLPQISLLKNHEVLENEKLGKDQMLLQGVEKSC